MEAPVWLHQFDYGYGPQVLGGKPDSDLPISAIYGKTNDGLTWQGHWDTAPEAISGVGALLRTVRQRYGAAGIDFVPWGVIHGRWEGEPRQAAKEGARAALIAKACVWPGGPARYIVDLEPFYHAPFKAFWRNDLGAGPIDVLRFAAAFQANGGDELWVAPDARDPHLTPVSFGIWAGLPIVTRVLPQVCYTDFVKPRTPTPITVRTALERAIDALGAHGWADTASIHPILPGDSPASLIPFAMSELQRLGCSREISFYQRASLRLDTAKAIAEE
ncbi:MAG: hypothetical protein O7A71_08240 [Chloroflexi bacterium]|nr:hypothetical protein [Chloroflexota bacterium]